MLPRVGEQQREFSVSIFNKQPLFPFFDLKTQLNSGNRKGSENISSLEAHQGRKITAGEY